MTFLHKFHKFFAKRLFILGVVSLLALIIGQIFGRRVWQAELFSHFLPYYSVILLLAGMIKPLNKNRLITTFRAIFLVVGVGLVIWCLPSYQQIKKWYQIPQNPRQKQTLIAYQNVNINNSQKQKTLAQLTKNNPQILILLEAGGDWSPYLETLKQTYPTHCGHDEFSPFAMQVFAKNKQADCEIIYLNPQQKDLPIIKLTLANQQIIYAVHPPPPINQHLAKNRLAYLQKVKNLVQNEPKNNHLLVIGDINTTAFSPLYRDFIEGTGLQANTANGLPTWLPFMIGIDHILSTQDNLTVTPIAWQGSDHRGFLIYP